jgi:hypothetical protein
MRNDDALTVELVQRLFRLLQLDTIDVRPLRPPAPDVLGCLQGGRKIAVEQTTLHIDERPRAGSPLRAKEERTSRANPGTSPAGWLPVTFIDAFELRVREKTAKAPSYAKSMDEEMWLLVNARLPQIPGLLATFIVPGIVNADEMNERTHTILAASPFDEAYFHIVLGNGLYSWSRADGWRAVREPDSYSEGGDMLQMLRGRR